MLAGMIAAIVVIAGPAGGAQADDEPAPEPQFTRFHVDVATEESGDLFVEMDVDYDFADEPSHGIYLSLLEERDVEGDGENVRRTPITSIDGGNAEGDAEVLLDRSGAGVNVRLGDPDTEVTGLHTYFLDYEIEGVVDSGTGTGGADEIYWNIIGTNFEEPINDIEIEVAGPGEIVAAECWAGEHGSTAPCSDVSAGSTDVTFVHDRLEPGEGITIGIAYQPGMFLPQTPILAPADESGTSMWLVVLGAILSIVVGIGTYSGIAWLFRDDKYRDLPLGLTPLPGQEGEVGKAGISKPEPAVAFTPPKGLTPAESAALLNDGSGSQAVKATIVDFAVRGYLTITTQDKGMILTKLRELPPTASEYEKEVFGLIFAQGDENLIEHSNTRLTKGFARARKTLLKSLVDKEWIKPRYVGKAKAIRIVAFIGALPLLLLLIGFIHYKVYDTAALLAIPFAFFAGMGFADDHAFQRTASGYARYAQTLAFRKYLKTAETHRLEFEIDEEVFSRYLPYAMAYGDVNRWLTLFENAPDRAPAGLAWLNGGAADIVTDSSSRNRFLLRLNLMRVPGGYSGSFSSSGGSVGGGVGGGGGGRW